MVRLPVSVVRSLPLQIGRSRGRRSFEIRVFLIVGRTLSLFFLLQQRLLSVFLPLLQPFLQNRFFLSLLLLVTLAHIFLPRLHHFQLLVGALQHRLRERQFELEFAQLARPPRHFSLVLEGEEETSDHASRVGQFESRQARGTRAR